MENIKEIAISTQTPTNNIVAEASVNLSQWTCGQLPSPIKIKRTIQRVKARNEQAQGLPKTLNEIRIP